MSDDLYPVIDKLANVAAYYAATSASFYGLVAHAVDPKRIKAGPARLLFEVARAHYLETKKPIANSLLALQRVRVLQDDGRVKHDELIAVLNLLEDVQDDPTKPSVGETSQMLVPIIQRALDQQIAQQAGHEYSNRKDFSKTVSLVEQRNRLGVVDVSGSNEVECGAMADVITLGNTVARLPVGFPEIDFELRQGMPIGSLGIWLGGTGDGKSVALVHCAAEAIRLGKEVACATLELPLKDFSARLLANLTGGTIDAVLAEPSHWEAIAAKRGYGGYAVKWFTPLATSFSDIAKWVEEREQRTGRRVEVLITDYGDKLSAPQKRSEEGGYRTGLIVFESMRLWAEETQRWHWTASQAQRREKKNAKGKRKVLEVDDVADSMHKARVGDLILSINRDEGQVIYHAAKFRHGRDGWNVGPIPHAYDQSRLYVMNDEAEAAE